LIITLPQADRIYIASQKARVRYVRVDHPLFRQFSDHARHLLRSLDDLAGEPDWSDLVRLVKRYRYAAAACPMALNDPAILLPGLTRQLGEIVGRLGISYGHGSRHLVGAAEAVLEDFTGLARCGDRPLGVEVERLVGEMPRGTVAVVVPDSRLVEAGRRSLEAYGCLADVVAASTARDLTGMERVVVLGSARWFPEHVFAAPRAPDLRVVSYRWIRCRWEHTGAFIAGVRGAPNWQAGDEGEEGEEDEVYATDWGHLATRLRGDEAHLSDGLDSVTARLFTLHGGYAVVLEADGNSTALIIDVDADESSQVQRVRTTNVHPGIFLLLRTEGSGDYVSMVADRLLGPRAEQCRRAQHHWKALLRARVHRSSVSEVARELRAWGSAIADESNVRRWCSDYGIATDAATDFGAIAQLVGLGGVADDYWRMMREIQNAHIRAGGRIRRQLLAEVRKADLRVLEHEGHMDFALPDADGGKLTAFRIEERAPGTKTGQAFRVEH
jgi:hypothetical protein